MFIEISESIQILLIIEMFLLKNDYEMCLYWFCMGSVYFIYHYPSRNSRYPSIDAFRKRK